jgi:hypothetical protein
MITKIIQNSLINSTIGSYFNAIDAAIFQLSRANQNLREDQILNHVTTLWNGFSPFHIATVSLGNNQYSINVTFDVHLTHQNQILVDDEILEPYNTEFGDFAFLVEYYLDYKLINRKISIIQTKIDNRNNTVNLPLHQLYLMTYWPNVKYQNVTYSLVYHHPDSFSFYHIILRYSQNQTPSSVFFSAPYISEYQGIKRSTFIRRLILLAK